MADTMTSIRVAIIGAGIAGPVLAMLLKQKGYDPVLYERSERVTTTGLSLLLQPNGMKVLRLIPGLLESLPGRHVTHHALFSTVTNRTLALHDAPTRTALRYGSGLKHGMHGVQREAFQRALIEQATARGVPIHWGHSLEGLEEHEGDSRGGEAWVEIRFTNGETARASFVVGCDGTHSSTRTALFGKMKPEFTGKVQTGGMSPRPLNLKNIDGFCIFLGTNAHMVAYPITNEHYSWAITQPEEEGKESWRSIDEKQKEAFKAGPFAKWSLGAGEIVQTTVKVIKYGLYDRAELKTWHKGRVVLLGDAAHPTTPHLGQGANQAFEDIYHLVRALVAHHPTASTPPTTVQLSSAFADYERARLPRSAEMVRKAHERGELRIDGNVDPEAVSRREGAWTAMWDEENIWKEMDAYSHGPYEGESEI